MLCPSTTIGISGRSLRVLRTTSAKSATSPSQPAGPERAERGAGHRRGAAVPALVDGQQVDPGGRQRPAEPVVAQRVLAHAVREHDRGPGGAVGAPALADEPGAVRRADEQR